jgi:hypothetical protein
MAVARSDCKWAAVGKNVRNNVSQVMAQSLRTCGTMGRNAGGKSRLG